MSLIKFNDGTPSMEARIFVKAESVVLVKDHENHFCLINRAKIDESKDVDFDDKTAISSLEQEDNE